MGGNNQSRQARARSEGKNRLFDSEINLYRLFGTIYCRLRRYPVGGAHCAPRQRKIIRFVGEHSDSLRAAYGGCSLDAHCGGCVRPTGYMVQNHVSQQTSAPVSSLDKTGASVYNTDIRTAFTCRVRSFPVASLELEENAAAFLGGGYFLRFKIPKTTVASSIRSISTSIVVMRVTPLFQGITSPFHISSFIIAYMASYCQ